MNDFNKFIFEKTGKFPIGAWVPYYRDALKQERLRVIAESGINFLPTITCGKAERDMLSKAGLKILVNDDRVTYCNVTGIGKVEEWLSEYMDDPDIMGVFVWDEPSPTMMRLCGAINQTIQQACKNTFGFINLHPEYSDKKLQRDGLSYEEYLEFFIKSCSPKVICYDNYPFYEDGFHDKSFFYNLSAIRNLAKKHSLPFWAFIQSSSFGKNVMPTKAEMLFQINAIIAYGAQGYLYFTYGEVVHENGFGSGLVDKNGNKTELYSSAKQINEYITENSKILLSLEPLGVRFYGKYEKYSDYNADFSGKVNGNVLLGFLKGETQNYVYAVNTDFADRACVSYNNVDYALNAGEGVLIKL